MLDHIVLRVSDIQKSKYFYTKALAPLGYKIFIDRQKSAGFGLKNKHGGRDFWIKEGRIGKAKSFGWLAFVARGKKAVRDFYNTALKVGGKDNGAPGYRPKYHVGYYAAFVLDPDGYNIEAVFDDLEKLRKSDTTPRDY